MNAQPGIVIVGGSAAGLAVAQSVRREGYAGPVSVVADEPGLPYDRPPLSKQVALGAWEPRQAWLTTRGDLDGLDLKWLSGRRAVDVSLHSRTVVLDDGESLAFEDLVVATGLRARRPAALVPPGVRGVHVLRTLEDALELRRGLVQNHRVVIIGAGFVGTELAATARAAGLEVALVDPLPRPLGAVLSASVSDFLARLHRDNGVDVRCGSGVECVESDDGHVSGVVLTDGTRLVTRMVVVALGSTPAVDWLRTTGLDLSDGVLCDSSLRAAPHVYAVGDVARAPRPGVDQPARVEHKLNATEQGMHVGRQLAHREWEPCGALPYFWTDQFGVRVQGWGSPRSDDETHVMHGSVEEGRFVIAHAREGRVAAVTGVGRPREFRAARELLHQSAPSAELVGRSSTSTTT